jgi:hypothetical protein
MTANSPSENRTNNRDTGRKPEFAAPVIVGEPGSFARSVLDQRHPALIRQVRDAFPFGPRQNRALDALLYEITEGVVEPLDTSEPGHGRWAVWGREHFGRSWFDIPFLWAESYFYRKLLAAVGHFGEGPWRGVDPFLPFKGAELRSPAVDEELRALDELADLEDELGGTGDEPAGRAASLLRASLWGNRADLGFRVTEEEPAATWGAASLVSDDSTLLWSLLPVGAPTRRPRMSSTPSAGSSRHRAGQARPAPGSGAP